MAIDSITDFTAKGFGELKAALEPWFLGRSERGAPASAGAGDYVFLDEFTVPSIHYADPVTFLDIPQTYRHLVFELVLVSDDPAADANPPDDILITVGSNDFGDFYSDDYVWAQEWLWDGFHTENVTFEDIAFPVRSILPAYGVNGSGIGVSYCRVRVEFPYYSLGLMPTCRWEGVSQVQSPDPGNFTDVRGVMASGGGTNTFDAQPVDRVAFKPATYNLRGGFVSMYGIV